MMANPVLYSPTKKVSEGLGGRHPQTPARTPAHKGRRASETGSLWSSRTYSAKSRTLSEQNLSTTVSEKERKITLMNLTSDKNQRLQRLNTATVQGRPRRNTYVIDKVSEDHNLNSSTAGTNATNVSQNKDPLSSTLHAGGIKALLDKANKGHHDFVFPPEVKAYIVSHFRMIREENLKLNKSLEKAAEDQQKNSENLKVTKGQLEREKAKNKVMLKRLKAENSSNHNSADEGQSLPDVIWFDQKKVDQNLQKVDQNLQKVDHNLQKVDQNRNIEIRPPSAAPTPATPAKADIKARVETKATNSTTGTESRPATARTSLVYSSNAKGDQANERKIKLLNKTLKSLRVDISNLQKENNHMKKVLIKEIGSEEEVSKAILSEDFSSEKSSQIKSRGSCWQGRAAKISNLETQLENLKNHVANSQANNSSSTAGSSSESSSSSPKYHPNNRRGIGDGSSRQGSLTPANFESHGDKEMKGLQMKYEEESTIRKVSEVERERLGEHVRVLTRRLRSAEETVIASEVALRSERKQNAELQKLLEKAHVELRSSHENNENYENLNGSSNSSNNSSASTSASPGPSPVSSNKTNKSINGYDLSMKSLQQELRVTKDNLENISKKREDDLDMYLRLASDSRTMFKQGLKEARIQEKN